MAIEKIRQRVKVDGPQVAVNNGLGLNGSIAELSNDLLNIRVRIANFGRGQLNSEIKRQVT